MTDMSGSTWYAPYYIRWASPFQKPSKIVEQRSENYRQVCHVQNYGAVAGRKWRHSFCSDAGMYCSPTDTCLSFVVKKGSSVMRYSIWGSNSLDWISLSKTVLKLSPSFPNAFLEELWPCILFLWNCCKRQRTLYLYQPRPEGWMNEQAEWMKIEG